MYGACSNLGDWSVDFNLCQIMFFQGIFQFAPHFNYILGFVYLFFCRIVFRHASVSTKTYCRGSPTGAQVSLAAWSLSQSSGRPRTLMNYLKWEVSEVAPH